MIAMLMEAVQSTSDVMSIIRDVHSFYNDAWTSLLWAVGIGGGAMAFIIGVLLPWWNERSRRESFRMDKESLIKQIEAARMDMMRHIDDATKMYKDNLQVALLQVAKAQAEAKRDTEAHAGDSYTFHALHSRRLGDYQAAAFFNAWAIKCYLAAGDEQSLGKIEGDLNVLSQECAEIPALGDDNTFKILRDAICEILQEIETRGLSQKFAKFLTEIKASLSSKKESDKS